LANIKRDVKVKRIWAIAGNFNVLHTVSHALERRGNIKPNFCLGCSNKELYFEMLVIKNGKVCRLDILVINQDVIRAHAGSSTSPNFSFLQNTRFLLRPLWAIRAEGGPTLTLSRAAAGLVERDERWHATTLKTNPGLGPRSGVALQRVVGPGMGRRRAIVGRAMA
jgi:hypothetical protein